MDETGPERPLSAEPREPPGGPVDVPDLVVDAPERRDVPDEDVNPQAGLPEPPD